MTDKLNEIKELLKTAIRESMKSLEANHADETFYAFALYDAEGAEIAPSSNTQEQFQRIVSRDGFDPDFRYGARWGSAEWAYECEGEGPYDEACELLDELRNDMYDEDDEGWYATFRARSFGTSIFALKEVAEEGLFHDREHPITAFFTLSDDDDAPWLELESARRINPPEVFAAFEAEWKQAVLQTWGDYDTSGGELGKAMKEFWGEKW